MKGIFWVAELNFQSRTLFIILYYVILYYIILYYIILYCIILYYIILYYIILYCIILYYIILYYIILYYIILYYIILYYILFYFILLYYSHLWLYIVSDMNTPKSTGLTIYIPPRFKLWTPYPGLCIGCCSISTYSLIKVWSVVKLYLLSCNKRLVFLQLGYLNACKLC